MIEGYYYVHFTNDYWHYYPTCHLYLCGYEVMNIITNTIKVIVNLYAIGTNLYRAYKHKQTKPKD